MSDEVRLVAHAAPRCFHVYKGLQPPEICGAEATMQRRQPSGRFAYVCADHQQPGDAPIVFPCTVPRVRVVIELEIAGVSWHPSAAKAEAVEICTLAARGVGADLFLHSVLLTTASYSPPQVAAAANASEGDG